MRPKSGDLDPLAKDFPAELQTGLYALYSHYEKTYEAWRQAGIETPPVFIVVCNNTATSKLVYEWISGFEREDDDGELRFRHRGHLPLFRNYDEHGNRMTEFNTLLVDSEALESGEGTLDAGYREVNVFVPLVRTKAMSKPRSNARAIAPTKPRVLPD